MCLISHYLNVLSLIVPESECAVWCSCVKVLTVTKMLESGGDVKYPINICSGRRVNSKKSVLDHFRGMKEFWQHISQNFPQCRELIYVNQITAVMNLIWKLSCIDNSFFLFAFRYVMFNNDLSLKWKGFPQELPLCWLLDILSAQHGGHFLWDREKIIVDDSFGLVKIHKYVKDDKQHRTFIEGKCQSACRVLQTGQEEACVCV